MIRQLDVPEAGQLVHQDRVLLYEGVEDVLHTVNKQIQAALLGLLGPVCVQTQCCFSENKLPESVSHRGVQVFVLVESGRRGAVLSLCWFPWQPQLSSYTVGLFTETAPRVQAALWIFKTQSRSQIEAQQTL